MRIFLKTHNIGGQPARVPYTSFFFLLIVFLLAQPFQFFYSLERLQPQVPSTGWAQVVSAGNLERQVGLSLLALFAIFSLRLHKPLRFHTRRCLCWPVLLFLSWACMSIIWSDEPSLTARRVGLLLFLSLGAVGVGKSFSYRNVLQFTFVVGMVTVAGGLFCELALGTFHPFEVEYRFAGIMDPIFAGWNCSLWVIAIVALARNKPHLVRLGYRLLFVGVTGFLLLTKSRGALAGASLGLLTYFILVSSRRRIAAAVYATAMIACGLFLFGFLLRQDVGGTGERLGHALLLGRTGDPALLTERTPLWKEVALPYFMEAPVAGYGYNSFWSPDRLLKLSPARGGSFRILITLSLKQR